MASNFLLPIWFYDPHAMKAQTSKLSDRRRKRPVGRNNREPILLNRSPAQRGGDSLERLVGRRAS